MVRYIVEARLESLRGEQIACRFQDTFPVSQGILAQRPAEGQLQSSGECNARNSKLIVPIHLFG
jgi:hypothetical protein